MLVNKQIARFVVVGVVNTLVGYGLYALFILIGFHYVLAVVFSTILGVLFNFKTISKFVFEKNDSTLLVKFILVYAVVFFINVGIIKLTKFFGYNDYIGGLIALIPVAGLSFVLNKYLVYKV